MTDQFIAYDHATKQVVDPTVYDSHDGAARAVAQSGRPQARVMQVVRPDLVARYDKLTEAIDTIVTLGRDHKL